jgi:hypothetical protein
MFVHLGGDVIVDAREVVAILDARRLQRTAEARALLERAVAARPAGVISRAIVVTTRGVQPAPVTAATVARRIEELLKSPGRGMAER